MGQEVLSPVRRNGHGGRREGGGRPGNSPNKIGGNIRQMILDAVEHLGGENYFLAVAVNKPEIFCALVGKILPTVVVIPPNDDGDVTEIRRTMVLVAPPKK